MSGNSELLQAMGMFADSVKTLKIQRTISGANEAVQQIKTSELKEEEKRAQLGQLANKLTMDMAMYGAPVSQIESVTGSFKPKAFANPDQMIMEGYNSGDQGLIQRGQEADRAVNAGKLELMNVQDKRDEAKQMRLFAHQERLTAARASKQTKPMTQGQSDKIAELRTSLADFQALGKKLESNSALEVGMGPVASEVPALALSVVPGNPSRQEINDFRGEAMRNAQTYRRAITGMAASIPELAEMPIALPTPKDDPKTFKQKLATLQEQGKRVLSIYVDTQRRAGKDVSEFEDLLAPASNTTTPNNSSSFFKPYK